MADKMSEDRIKIARKFAYDEVPNGDAWEHAMTMRGWFQSLFDHLEAVEAERDEYKERLEELTQDL